MTDSLNYHISIDYQDNSLDNPYCNTYEAVQLMMPGGEVVRFETNDPVEDYKSAIRLAQLMQHVKPGAVFLSSDVNHFTNDVAGYRWNDGDLIEINPEQPPIVLPQAERVDLETLTAEQWTAVLLTEKALRVARQTGYDQSKAFAPLRHAFEDADSAYRRHCTRYALKAEPIFDREHYQRERRATGEALDAPSFGRKGRAA